MIWVSLSDNLCWGVIEKCASTSMHKAFDQDFFRHVSILEASKHKTVVSCIRDPIDRLWAVFNHFYELMRDRLTTRPNKRDYNITSFGAVLRAGNNYNFKIMNEEKKELYLQTIGSKRRLGESDAALAYRLDAIDYMTFVGNVLNTKGTEREDTHWMPQSKQFLLGDKSIITDLHKFENLNDIWSTYFTKTLPKINSHQNINKDVFFRCDELRDYYKDDYELRGAL